jgi:hypothetical protein
MNKNTKRLDGKKILVTLTKQLEDDMRSYCRLKGIESENELIRQAVGKFIYADYEDETMKLQGIKHNQEKIAELRDMLSILFSYIKLSHINILAYMPDIDPSLFSAAANSAYNRHDIFFNRFQDSLKNDPPFFERLLHKYYSEDNG